MLKQIFSKRDNLLSLIVIFTAIILLILRFTTDLISTDKLLSGVLSILTLISIGNIIERESRFTKLDEHLDHLSNNLTQPFFRSRKDCPAIEEISQGAEELFFTGGHLHSLLIQYQGFFHSWLKEGRKLKFIVLNPDNYGLKHMKLPCIDYDPEAYITQIQGSLGRLKALAKTNPGKIEVRLSDITITTSVTILDGHIGGRLMNVLLHLPNGDARFGPIFTLSRDGEKRWFEVIFDRYYNFLWKAAIPYDLTSGD